MALLNNINNPDEKLNSDNHEHDMINQKIVPDDSTNDRQLSFVQQATCKILLASAIKTFTGLGFPIYTEVAGTNFCADFFNCLGIAVRNANDTAAHLKALPELVEKIEIKLAEWKNILLRKRHDCSNQSINCLPQSHYYEMSDHKVKGKDKNKGKNKCKGRGKEKDKCKDKGKAKGKDEGKDKDKHQLNTLWENQTMSDQTSPSSLDECLFEILPKALFNAIMEATNGYLNIYIPPIQSS